MLSLAKSRAALHLARAARLVMIAIFVTLAGAARAHEGHDHGPPAPPLPTTVKPRIVLETELYQIVAIAGGTQLTIFLDRYATNEPITEAAISITAGNATISAQPRKDGSYVAEVPSMAPPGRHELLFNVSYKDGDDLLAGALEIPPPESQIAGEHARPAGLRALIVGHLATVMALFVGLALGLALRSRRTLVVPLALALGLAADPSAPHAHEGHGPSPVPEGTSLSGDIPRRLPDGSVFMPKPSQRLLTVRSQVVTATEARRGVTLVGRIIADPNRSGVVQSINGGRVVAPERGLPRLGQSVRRGETLVTVAPALPLADQSTLAEKQRELEGAILLARQRLTRLTRLGGNVTPRSNIEDTELEITNIEQRLASLRAAQLQPEVLTAPIDGVISTSGVVAGQVVRAQDIVFQIVDPASMWVEALLFDQIDPAAIVEASGLTPGGTPLRLEYRGRGRTLQAQAVQVQFAILEPPGNIALGQPVTVIARNAEPVKGMLLPRDAVVRGPAGETIVWQQLEPERFVARQIRVEPFDGAQMLVTGGIAPQDRIVVHAAELLTQVR
jgi:cobalt-zinc-cadmium efflux system membrane fusion protein